MIKILRKFAKFAHDRKPYLEIITALLTIPVLITVIFLNLNNITNKDEEKDVTDPQQPTIIIENKTSPNPNQNQNDETSTSNQQCKKEIGPISISYPKEGEVVSENPISFNIKHDDEVYCKVVWSYRINNGSWSQFGANAPTVYNLSSGEIKFELRIQSTVSDDEDLIVRYFTYKNPDAEPSTTSE